MTEKERYKNWIERLQQAGKDITEDQKRAIEKYAYCLKIQKVGKDFEELFGPSKHGPFSKRHSE